MTNNVGRNQSLGIQSVHTEAPCLPSLSNGTGKQLPNSRCNEIVSNPKADGLFDADNGGGEGSRVGIAAHMPQANVFSVLDAISGYWQIHLSDRSSYLTTYS